MSRKLSLPWSQIFVYAFVTCLWITSKSLQSNAFLSSVSKLPKRNVPCNGPQMSISRKRSSFVKMSASTSDDKEITPRKRVVVTGLGPVSAVGTGNNEFWNNLIDGQTGIDTVSAFDPLPFASQIGGQVKDFDATLYMKDPKSAVRNDRYTLLGVGGAKIAAEDAGLTEEAISKMESSRFGVIFGTAMGGISTLDQQIRVLEEKGPRGVSPLAIPMLLGNTVSGIIGIELGFKGPNFVVMSACAAATHALGVAFNAIRNGEADVVISGGSEAPITPFGYAGFCAMKAMCTKFNDNPKAGSRPFDKDRCGFVMGEGAGVLVLEELEHAKKRGAKIYAELAGYGATCDAHHITMPHPEGVGLGTAIDIALKDGNIRKEEVDYINAHGTSTPYNDKFETAAIKKAFGEELAYKINISSTKGATGHTLGAAGGLEAIAAVKAIETGVIPPTLNYETHDPDCDLNITPNKSIKREVKAALSSNLGFGGHNGVVAFTKYKE